MRCRPVAVYLACSISGAVRESKTCSVNGVVMAMTSNDKQPMRESERWENKGRGGESSFSVKIIRECCEPVPS